MLDQKVLDLISKEAMQQYEIVRKSGICNMFDMTCIAEVCSTLEFQDLLEITEDRKSYSTLLMNFSDLMEHYGITQN